jgi:hypothetical protein
VDCFIRFDEVSYLLWHTRDPITNAEAYDYPGFRESFRKLRREARKSEIALVIALYEFRLEMEEQATDADKPQHPAAGTSCEEHCEHNAPSHC